MYWGDGSRCCEMKNIWMERYIWKWVNGGWWKALRVVCCCEVTKYEKYETMQVIVESGN